MASEDRINRKHNLIMGLMGMHMLDSEDLSKLNDSKKALSDEIKLIEKLKIEINEVLF